MNRTRKSRVAARLNQLTMLAVIISKMPEVVVPFALLAAVIINRLREF